MFFGVNNKRWVDVLSGSLVLVLISGPAWAARSTIGVEGRSLSKGKTEAIDADGGVKVVKTVAGCPADGVLLTDDIITELNGQPIRNVMDLSRTVGELNVNDTVVVVYFRGIERQEVQVLVAESRLGTGCTAPDATPELAPTLETGQSGIISSPLTGAVETASTPSSEAIAPGEPAVVPVVPSTVVTSAPVASSAPVKGVPGDMINQIERLQIMHDKGYLSDEEFTQAKAQVLGTATD